MVQFSLRALTASLVFAAVLGPVGASAPRHAAAAVDARPNIVLIVSDDQRWDTLWAMPHVREELGEAGTTFSNAFVVNPVCCPSRASILTGRYSHTTGVWTNDHVTGGFQAFDDSASLATWLSGGGYRTGLIGKYLNGYHQVGRETGYVPPGWDHFWSFVGGEYSDFDVNEDGSLVSYGTEDYVTDIMAAEAIEFIQDPDPRPFFLYLTPKAPHMPATPAPRHTDAFADLAPWRPPSWNEPIVEDKPAWMRKIPPLSQERIADIDARHLGMFRSLLALDEMVNSVVETLRASGELDNTFIVFTSDNGYSWGEHRWDKKATPYEESIHVPLVIRYDGVVPPGRLEERFTLNVDFAPTIGEVANVTIPGAEGSSLVRLFGGGRVSWRSDFLVEHADGRIPAYCGVRTARWKYVWYTTEEEELYDLAYDPYERRNRAGRPRFEAVQTRMRDRMMELCSPSTPGMVLPP